MIRLEQVGYRLGDFALEDINLRIPEGKYGLVIGPTGSGKTSVLEIIAGHAKADRGRVHLYGRDVSDEPPERRGVGVVYQRVHLFPHLDIAHNIGYGLRHTRMTDSAKKERVQELADQLGLAHIIERSVTDLSGGEAQRVGLARALAPRPRILLLDEPFASLDPATRNELRAQLLDLHEREGVTTLQVTHDFEEALRLGDVVVVMAGGRIVQRGNPEEVFRHPNSAFVAQFMGSANVIAGRVKRSGDGQEGRFPASFTTAGALSLEVIAEREGQFHAVIHPEDILLSRTPPVGSARNTLRATITSLEPAGPITYVHLDAGHPLRAVITAQSADGMALGAGQTVFATVKATAILLV